ncbi:MAG: DUF3943 domain-containing protein [Puia sp.]|nr:DUF3943 domain-containing protein [Puia sp.]
MRYLYIFLASFLYNSLTPAFCQPALPSLQFPKSQGFRVTSGAVHVRDTLPRKRFGRAAGELMLAEITPWLFDRYLRNEDYAHISFQTLGYNIKPSSWTWDNDPFVTNQFGHPYHGSLFFNAFRENGYSFWQAAPAAFAGSYLWETVAENQPPAPNDFINTGFGGIMLGEMSYRLANKIVNNNSRGFGRQVSEVVALLINPVNGLNRILEGKWGRPAGDPARRDTSEIVTEFDMGVRKFKVDNRDGSFGWYGHVKLLYGTPFENYKTPFSHMYLNAELGKDDSSFVNLISVYGSLSGWMLHSTETDRHLLLLTANYDFIRNEAFFYSSQNVKLNLFSEFGLPGKTRINTSVGGGLIILAAVPDLYITPNGRDYDYCTGAAFNAGGGIGAGRFFYGINYRGAWLKTINGNPSHYLLHTATSEFRCRIVDGLSVCAEPGYFTLLGRYRDFPGVDKTYPYIRISCKYSWHSR